MDAVIEFTWRNPGYNRDDFQLVTWGRDSILTLWPIGAQLKVMCGDEDDDILQKKPNIVTETKEEDSNSQPETTNNLNVSTLQGAASLEKRK